MSDVKKSPVATGGGPLPKPTTDSVQDPDFLTRLAEHMDPKDLLEAQAEAERTGKPVEEILQQKAEKDANRLAWMSDAYRPADAPARTKASAQVEDSQDGVTSNLGYTTPASHVSAPEVGERGLSASVQDRDVTVGAGVPAGSRMANIEATLDRFGINLSAAKQQLGQELSASFYAMEGYYSASLGQTVGDAKGRRPTERSAGVFYTPQGGGLSGSVAWKRSSGDSINLSGFIGGTATREVLDHGPYRGEEEALLGKRCVELKSETGFLVGLLPGLAGSMTVGIGGRLNYSSSHQVSYRTHVEPDRARALLYEQGGWLRKALRNRGRALGMVEEPLKPPRLEQPTDLKIGDSLTLGVSGTFSGGFSVGASSSVYIGVQGGVTGDFELGFSRPDKDTLEVTVVPTRVRTIEVGGRVLVVDATWARSNAHSLAQRFRFDLREPTAVAAFQRVLRGDIPSGTLRDLLVANPGTLRKVREVLPRGITREPVETVRGVAIEANANVGFLWSLLGISGRRADFQYSMGDGDHCVYEHVRSIERTHTIPFSGDETRGVRAAVISAASNAGEIDGQGEFAYLELVGYLVDTKARGFELNDDLRLLNRTFGTHLGEYHEKSLGKARSIELRTQLGADDFADLVARPAEELRAAARASGASSEVLVELAARLRGEPDPYQQAELVQEQVARGGLEVMGALVRLYGLERMKVSTSMDVLGDWLLEADRLLFKYERPVTLETPRHDLLGRFKEINDLQGRLGKLARLVGDDPLIEDDARGPALQRIQAARDQLSAKVDLAGLSRDQLLRLIHRVQEGPIMFNGADEAIGALVHARRALDFGRSLEDIPRERG